MFSTHRPTLTLQLHNFDLSRTCCTSSFCTVAWLARFQLTRRIMRSLGNSWACCKNGSCPPSWIFEIQFFNDLRSGTGGSKIALSHWQSPTKFCKDRWKGAEISQFLWFSRWRPPPSWIFKNSIFYGRSTLGSQYASPCQISSKSVTRLQRYGYLTFFSKWRPSAILELLGAHWDHPR